MKGWWPSPSGQLSDPRVARLSLNGRGLLWSLCDAADGRGAVGLGAMRLDDVLLALSGRTPEADVRSAWAELEGVRLAYVEGGLIVLDLAEPDVSQTETFAGPTAAAGEVTTRTDKASATGKLKAWFSKLKLKTVETRAAWLEEEHGRKTLERLGLTLDEARPLVEAAGRKGGRFGHERAALTRGGNPPPSVTADGGNHGGNVTSAAEVTTEVTRVSPTPPSGEKNKDREGVSGARATVVTPEVTGSGKPVTGPVTTEVTARLSSQERTVPCVTAGEVFFHLRGDGGLRLSAGVTHEKELDGVLGGVTPAWTLDGVKRLAVHIKAGHLRDGWKPKLDDLRGKDGTFARLLTLHDEAQDCLRCSAGTSHETPTGRRMFTTTTRQLVVATPTKRELEEVVRGSNG